MTLTEDQCEELKSMWNSGVDINPMRHKFGLSVKELNRVAFELGLRDTLPFHWDDEKDAKLKELVSQKLSSKKIGAELGCAGHTVLQRVKKLSLNHAQAWTSERLYLLKKYLDDDYSASEIAKELGGTTRNAVIGKVHRMGWEFNKSTGPRKQVLKTTKRLPKKVNAAKFNYPETPVKTKDSERVKTSEVFQLQPGEAYVSFIDHKDSQCRCIKEQGDKVLGYCAKPAEPGSRYCAEHTARFNRGNPYRVKENEEGQAA